MKCTDYAFRPLSPISNFTRFGIPFTPAFSAILPLLAQIMVPTKFHSYLTLLSNFHLNILSVTRFGSISWLPLIYGCAHLWMYKQSTSYLKPIIKRLPAGGGNLWVNNDKERYTRCYWHITKGPPAQVRESKKVCGGDRWNQSPERWTRLVGTQGQPRVSAEYGIQGREHRRWSKGMGKLQGPCGPLESWHFSG